MSHRYPHPDDSDEHSPPPEVQPVSTDLPIEIMDQLWAEIEGEDEDSNYEDVEGNDDDDDDDDEDEDEDEDEFHDAELEFELLEEEEGESDDEDERENDNEEEEEDQPGAAAAARPVITLGGGGGITQAQLQRLINSDGGAAFLRSLGLNLPGVFNSRRREKKDPNRFPKVPSDRGTELMASGTFGMNDRSSRSSSMRAKKSIARRILDRELGLGKTTNREMIAQDLIPSSRADMTIRYRAPVYCGQFSEDGNFFYACVKDFKVRMYDTSNPYNWRYYKTVAFPFGQWTLSDAHLSPDNKWLAYTSLQKHVCFAPTDPNDKGDPYALDMSGGRGLDPHQGWRSRDHFSIFALRFSGDGRELVVGNNANSIIIYDIESRQVLHNIQGHEDDVNAVCFADPRSPHIIYSGSDDQIVKIWDRRSMGDHREVGAFVGHSSGITYVDSKGDGRYVLSNGKDHSMKLWDLRKAMSTAEYAEKNPRRHTQFNEHDYRYGDFDDDDWEPHPDDNSVVTFRGHKVESTLIRCHFSPPGSTNSRYVYSGSADGHIYVWNLDATLAAKIKGAPSLRGYNRSSSTTIREPHWHPNAPIIAASSWVDDGMGGAVTVHSWNDSRTDDAEPRMGLKMDEHLAHEADFANAVE